MYTNRRWTAANSGSEVQQHKRWRAPETILCPACAQQRTGEPRGFVYLDGDFFVAHYEGIEQLLRNEAERAAEDNPFARIMEWKRGDNHRLTVRQPNISPSARNEVEKDDLTWKIAVILPKRKKFLINQRKTSIIRRHQEK